jgi:hypothetical protein
MASIPSMPSKDTKHLGASTEAKFSQSALSTPKRTVEIDGGVYFLQFQLGPNDCLILFGRFLKSSFVSFQLTAFCF